MSVNKQGVSPALCTADPQTTNTNRGSPTPQKPHDGLWLWPTRAWGIPSCRQAAGARPWGSHSRSAPGPGARSCPCRTEPCRAVPPRPQPRGPGGGGDRAVPIRRRRRRGRYRRAMAVARCLRGVRRLLPAGARHECCELARLAGPVVRPWAGRDGEGHGGHGAGSRPRDGDRGGARPPAAGQRSPGAPGCRGGRPRALLVPCRRVSAASSLRARLCDRGCASRPRRGRRGPSINSSCLGWRPDLYSLPQELLLLPLVVPASLQHGFGRGVVGLGRRTKMLNCSVKPGLSPGTATVTHPLSDKRVILPGP